MLLSHSLEVAISLVSDQHEDWSPVTVKVKLSLWLTEHHSVKTYWLNA